jgi:hydroxyacylglutathione hydrolase
MNIEPRDLALQIAGGRAPAILDVRSGPEYRRGHVPGAVHVPFWLLPFRLSRLPFDPDKPVVVYCGHGPRAWMAGAVLRGRGYRQVIYLKGHFAGWST